MIVLQQLAVNQVNVELNPSLTVSNWLFVFTSDDLNGKELRYFLVPTFESSRYYTFEVDTTSQPMITGEWVLKIYEKENTDNTNTTDLLPSYISKVRIYKEFPADFINTINLVDYRLN